MKASKMFKITTLLASSLIGVCVVMDVMHWIKYGYLIADKEFSYYIGIWLFTVAAANTAMLPLYLINLFASANRRVSKTFKDSEKFIYTRDLPSYNAAIAGALYDFKADYEQEFVAGIMDLIARGYIIEKRNSLEVDLPKVRLAMLEEGFLKCETFILGICEVNASRIKSGLMFDFRDALEEDLYNLGFYKKQVLVDKIKTSIYSELERRESSKNGFTGFIIIIYALLVILVYNWKLSLGIGLIVALIVMIVLRKTRLTKKGEEEKENMTKLKHFLDRETSFEQKDYKEKKLWDRYPAFAVALGVNKEMPKEIMRKLNIRD